MHYLVKVIWLLVQFFPEWAREPFRKSVLLSSWYTALLCKVGMHPSVNATLAEARQVTISDEPLDEDYSRNMRYQQRLIDDRLSEVSIVTPVHTVLLLVDDWDGDMCHCSLKSINQQTVLPEMIVLLCQPKQRAVVESYITSLNWLLTDIEVVCDLAKVDMRLKKTSGFVLYQGERLHSDCFAYIATCKIQTDFIYVDTDTQAVQNRYAPRFLPDWNPDLQLSTGYIRTGFYFARLTHIDSLIASRDSVANFFKQAYLQDMAIKVGHIPLVLLHHHKLTEPDEQIVDDTSKLFPLSEQPMVSMIIPTYNAKDLVEACLTSILDKTDYRNFEILLIDNRSDDPEAITYFESVNELPNVRVLKYPHPFNYSAINNFAVAHAKGEVIALVNNDIEVINGNWLEKMLVHTLRPDIGCVGAKLLFANGLVQHAGVVMGYGGGAGHAHKYFQRDAPGYMNRAIATQNFSAVTAACLLVEKKDYENVGGLNEKELTVAFNDVDFCLRINQSGKRNLLCAEAVLFHHESISRGHDDTYEKKKRFFAEVEYLQTTWKAYIEHDPAYNPNLTLKYENFTINNELTH
ncbi:glycosyltransferase family 2 protein [Glaciecola sp. KUL10]|uniref:glycosyltransferase family 2 protein n=1 Tax=Glaciecola sp. (strain KUL10) TaxID=2161813 RepID=UPI000D78458D|nr:glycosyltransferase family 2 protein [Glaciecola sp. KUL10]GBL04157.1 glycosyl transferase [Glaciecola sp. KUL10]